MQVFFFPCQCVKKQREIERGEESIQLALAICFLKELCPKVFRHHINSHAFPPGPCQPGSEPKPEAVATVARTLKQQRQGERLRPSPHRHHHTTRNEQQAHLSRNVLVVVITCPSCTQVFLDQILRSQMWLRGPWDSPLKKAL